MQTYKDVDWSITVKKKEIEITEVSTGGSCLHYGISSEHHAAVNIDIYYSWAWIYIQHTHI